MHEDLGGLAEVDLVLSTAELWELLTLFAAEQPHLESGEVSGGELSVEECLRRLQPDPVTGVDVAESLFRNVSLDDEAFVLAAAANSGSGGFLEHIARYAAARVLGRDLWDTELVYTQGRNPDIAAVTVEEAGGEEDGTGKRSLRFAKVYGFRNIQSIVQSLKRAKCEFDYIEVCSPSPRCIRIILFACP